ncbi:MAG TPA: kelch repeat-containing protein, partial [Ktedonobacterales bacterium]|nr:kelch repeat-containing protein [Ktedonobacterales bacterium]
MVPASARTHHRLTRLIAIPLLPLALLLVGVAALGGLLPTAAARGSRLSAGEWPRAFFGATTSGGRTYVMGGSFVTTDSPIFDLNQAYNPGDGTWQTLAPMPTPRSQLAVVAASDGRIYAIGGFAGAKPTLGQRDTVEAYDPRTNTWVERTPLPHPLADLAAVAGPDGRIYAMGGTSGPALALNTVYAYDPQANTWQSVAPMLTQRSNFAAAVSSGRIYAIGGVQCACPPDSAAVEAYTPATNSWQAVAPLALPRTRDAAATGSDGRIYVLGGFSPSAGSLSKSVEVYDPGRNAWSAATGLPTPRWGLAAAIAPDGRVIAFGGAAEGASGAFQETSVVESYNPSSNTWATLAPLPAPPGTPAPLATPTPPATPAPT